MENSLQYLVALSMVPSIGALTGRKLISYLGSAEAVFKEKSQVLQKIPGIGEILSGRAKAGGYLDRAAKEMEYCRRRDIRIFSCYDKDYPVRLKQCSDSPLVMYLKGENVSNADKIISVVGTRRATREGIQNISTLLSDIAEHYPSIIIVSGLAYGIDYNAHLSALKNSLKTIAVLGHGLHTIYPAENKNLAFKIIENGCILSDFASNMNPERNNFIKRNRIIAGLADATIVVESGPKGGALITADIANSYDRDVFAYPGRVSDDYSNGCNRLIKDHKAAMIEGLEDLEYLLNWERGSNRVSPKQKLLFVSLSQEEEKVVKALQREESLSRDSLALILGLPIYKLSAMLLKLEFEGIISVLPGNHYRMHNGKKG